MGIWNPWHGCKKYSSGCLNCYVYRRDSQFGKDSSVVTKTKDFDLPLKKKRTGAYQLSPDDGPVYTCMTSDFFINEADQWRGEIWKMIKLRSDLDFIIISKRIIRIKECLPEDWGIGYSNVTLISTCEDQQAADTRLPIFLEIPALHKQIIHEPMLEKIDISDYLASGQIEKVSCGGESGDNARICDYDWIIHTRKQCINSAVSFSFRQTGAKFRKQGKVYNIERKLQHSQAKKAGIDYEPYPENYFDPILSRLRKSEFRSRFRLGKKEIEYIDSIGEEKLRNHVTDFIENRLSQADPPYDGKQTPMKGHPAFIAQHACACCCRSCLQKWHGIPMHRKLNEKEKDYIISLLLKWISFQYKNSERDE